MGLTYSSADAWLDTYDNPHTPIEHTEACANTDLIILDESEMEQMKTSFHSLDHLQNANPDALFLFVHTHNNRHAVEFDQFIPEDLRDKVCVAGGAVVGNVLGLHSEDIDFYPIGDDPEDTVRRLVDFWMERGTSRQVTRTHRSITCEMNYRQIQVILTQNDTVADVLEQFDLDSCCMGYYQGEYMMNSRCKYAANHRMNVVDMNRMSDSYVHRLIKYAKRGFRVLIPGYTPSVADGMKAVHQWSQTRVQHVAELVANSYTHFQCYRRTDDDQTFSGYGGTWVSIPEYTQSANFKPIGLKCFHPNGDTFTRIVGYTTNKEQLWNPPTDRLQTYAFLHDLEPFDPELRMSDFEYAPITWRQFLLDEVCEPMVDDEE